MTSPRDIRRLVGHSSLQPEAGPAVFVTDEALMDAMSSEIDHLRADVSAFSFQHTLDNEELDRLRTALGGHAAEICSLRTALRAVRACTDPAWAATIISDALRETKP